MDKILYIGDNPSKITSGGDWINKRNILALQEVYKDNLHVYPVKCKNTYFTFANLLNKYMLGLSSNVVKNIIQYIINNNIETVFLASSKFGKLARKIKKSHPHIKIYVFFHNIEKQYTLEEYRVNATWKNLFIAKVTAYNESLSCLYADKLIVLNQRDNLLLKEIYNKKADLTLPTTFIDKFSFEPKQQIKSETFTLLCVGYAFFANIEGMKWFIDNVFKELHNCTLLIVGSGMDKVFKTDNNIKVFGYVEDLSAFYYKADAVILPIFSGGGMKTKTAEALMYGCPIIGTKEAFEGYELDLKKIGGLANTKEEMISCIEHLQNDNEYFKHCKLYARSIFLEKYDFQTTIKSIQQYL